MPIGFYPRNLPPLIERFNKRIVIDPETGCHNWTGAKSQRGYGVFSPKEFVHFQATRWIWEYSVGPIPEGHHMCHTCDNPSCVNVNHLFPGTRFQNMQDCVQKQRMHRQNRCGLTWEDICAIRNSDMKTKTLAEKHGVSTTTINRIRKNERWKYPI